MHHSIVPSLQGIHQIFTCQITPICQTSALTLYDIRILSTNILPIQDDMMVRVFNYNTLEKVEMFEAHSDYIRSIIVHPTQPYILTSSGKTIV